MQITAQILLVTFGSLSVLPDFIQSAEEMPWPYSTRHHENNNGMLANSNSFMGAERMKPNFRIVTDPKTGQRFRRPNKPKLDPKPVEDTSDRNSMGSPVLQSPSVKRPGIAGMTQESDGRFPGFNQAKDFDERPPFDYPEYYEPNLQISPALQEHLVTSHIRPIWSSQATLPRRRHSSNSPSSVVNIFIMTQGQPSGDVPSIHVDSSSDGPTNSNGKAVQQRPITIPIITSPKMKNENKPRVPNPPNNRLSSGEGLLDPK